MEQTFGEKVKNFVINHWVSWLIEILILSIVAYFTIAETRKTAEQTREMLEKYDAAISEYAKEKTEKLDQAVADSVDSAKEKAEKITEKGVKGLLDRFKKSEENKEEPEE